MGRDVERAQLRELLADAREGRSRVLVVCGEAGVGKTALLDDAVERAAGMQVVRAVGVESEAAMPFGALFDVCRSFLGSIGDLPDRQRGALEGALAMGPAGDGDGFAIGAATLSLLTGDREAPLLVVIDDAQWLDGASAASLAFALRRLDADDVAVLIGLRAGECDGFDATGFPMLELARLSPNDAVALAGSRRPVSREQALRIAAVSGGNPLAILELVASETTEVDGLVPIPAHVERTFATRVEQLPVETKEALLIAAVDDLGHPGRDRAGDVSCGPRAGRGCGSCAEILEARLEFRHPLVRSAIYQSASPTERRGAHAALAAALPPSQSSRRAWHRASSVVEPDEDLADAMEAVAVDAQARRGPGAAAAAWRRAAELTPGANPRARRLLAASEASWDAGAGDPARQAAGVALATCSDPLLHADIVRAQARMASQSGGMAEEISLMLRGEAAAVASLDSTRAAYLLADAVIAFWPAWDTESKVELARAAHEAAGDSDDPLFDHVLGFELAREGSVLESAPLLAAVERAIANDPVRRGDPRALLLAADCAWWRSDLRETCVLYVEAIARARELGLAALVAQTLADFASVQIDVGAWDEAAAGLSEARRLGEDTGQLTTVCLALCRQAEIAARRGEGDEFEELNAAAARYAGTATPTDAMERNSRCLLALGTGQPDVAIASREHRESYAIEQLSANALDLVEAYIRAGRLDEARTRLDEVETHVHLDEPRGAYTRCRALMADAESCDDLFTESLRLFDRLGDVFEGARTRLCYGERLRRANRRRDARRQLAAALDAFEQLRAASWADRTRRELRASGEHRRRQDSGLRDELTPQERQIATLAAEGRNEPGDRCTALPQLAHDRDTPRTGVQEARHQPTGVRFPQSVRRTG